MSTAHESLPVDPSTVRTGRHRASDFAREHGASVRRAADVGLAVSEALTNAVLHSGTSAQQNGIVLELACEGPELVVAVRDHGRGLRPRPDSPGMGLGLPIIASLADRVQIRRPRDGGTELSMVFLITA
jgi:anti-sigma regulatory factor (Ser/Thr protein kinase)